MTEMTPEDRTDSSRGPNVASRPEREFSDAELVELAKTNHMWLNAFACIRPTPEFLQSIGAQVIAALETSPILDDFIEAPRNVTYIRFNRS